MPVCFGTRDDKYGSFTITQAGEILVLKLTHLFGTLVCFNGSSPSFWGCQSERYGDKTLMTYIYIFHTPTNEELFYQGEPESKWEVHGDQWENASTKCIPTRSAVSMTLRLKSYSIRPLNHYACHTISSSGSGLDRTLLIVARKTMKAKAVLTCMAGITSKKNYFQEDFTFIHVQSRLSCNCS